MKQPPVPGQHLSPLSIRRSPNIAARSMVTNDETLLGPSLGFLGINICSYSRPRESDKAKSPRRVKTNHHNDADKAKDPKEPIKATRVLAWDRHIHTEQTTD